MYAEIRVFDDDDTVKNETPYVIPASDIHARSELVGNCEIVNHEFKFVWAERITKDPKEIDMLERERAAYKRGLEQGREEVERYYAGGRY